MISRSANPERNRLAAFMITFGVTVVTWAIAHDLHLVHVEPRHFTEFHRQLLPISNHSLLAVQYALVATTGPGLVIGGLAYVATRRGPGIKRSLRHAWLMFLPVLLAIEILSLLAGHNAVSRLAEGRAGIYPDSFYPELSPGVVYTQTVNLTSYLAALLLGGLYLTGIRLTRRAPD